MVFKKCGEGCRCRCLRAVQPGSSLCLAGARLYGCSSAFHMPWFLYIALKQLFPTGKWVSFFALMSILGIALGVGVLMVVQTVMNGFGEEIRKGIRESGGDLRIEGARILYDYYDLMDAAREVEGVAGVAPYAQGMVMVQYRNRPLFPTIRGFDTWEDPHVVPIDEFLLSGEKDALTDDTIFLSTGAAVSLGVVVGDTVSVYTPLMLERMRNNEILLPRDLEVAGVFQTGWNQIDSSTVVVSLRLMQELYGLEEGVHGLAVKINEGASLSGVQDALNALTSNGFRAYTWLESNRDFLFILSLEKGVMFFVMLFILLVACFSIVVTLMMSVMRKTREIGLMVAMGARPRDVALGYIFQSMLMGVVGTVVGFLGGWFFLIYRNEIKNFLVFVTQSEAAFVNAYQFADLPAHYDTGSLLAIAVFALFMSTCAGLFPALRAARLKPAEALRYE